MNILAIGDIVGSNGRDALMRVLDDLKNQYNIDLVIANGENASGGAGITYSAAQEIYKAGVDIITMGNHTWRKKEVLGFIDSETRLVRPANFPQDVPGKGSTIVRVKDKTIAIINLCGRVYMDMLIDCPFRVAGREIKALRDRADIIIVDFHAEATSEKIAMAWHLDGKVTILFGTHTHVQTADERIYPKGTAYITDIGMTGPYNSVIGTEKEIALKTFTTQISEPYKVAAGDSIINGIVYDIEETTNKVIKMQRINILVKE